MNLVSENINEAIKHLTPRSEEEMHALFISEVERLSNLDEHLGWELKKVIEEWVDPSEVVSTIKIYRDLFYEVDKETRKQAIINVMNNYIFG